MIRIPKPLLGLASLMLLTACLPLDAVPSDPQSPSGAGETVFPSEGTAPEPPKDLPLQVSPADGLDQRISALHELSIAYQLQGGEHPVDYAVPGSERVVLAESFSGSKRFELPGKQSGNSIILELTCSKSVHVRLEVQDAEGRVIGGGQSSACSADGPMGFGFGTSENRHVRLIQVAIDRETGIELSAVTFTSSEQDPPAGS